MITIFVMIYYFFLHFLAVLKASYFTGDKTMEGGVVNHGYVGDAPTRNNNRPTRFPSSSDSTSGYYSTGLYFYIILNNLEV